LASDVVGRLLALGISILAASSVASRPQPSAGPTVLVRWRSLAALTRPPGAGGDECVLDHGDQETEEAMTLKLYPVVLELVRRLASHLGVLKARSSNLGDQFERALTSVPLNVAEGAYGRGKNRQVRYQTALASAREALSCWETAQALGWVGTLDPEVTALFNRVIGTLVRLSQPRR
jgi:four helix bundle protein